MGNSTEIVRVMHDLWPKNKAKGILAQAVLMQEIKAGVFGKDAREKMIPGCWVLAPKRADFHTLRFSFFVHPKVLKTGDIPETPKAILGEMYRPFHAVSEFIDNSGIGLGYVIPSTKTGELPYKELGQRMFGEINWNLYCFRNGSFEPFGIEQFFNKWAGNRGRASYGKEWDQNTTEKMPKLNEDVLVEILLKELFMTGYLKNIQKKPFNDPYDLDSFMISLSQKQILPMEIKEKFPGGDNEKFFGIDAGRILLLLRFCLPNDANAVYLIREMDEAGKFIGWKYMTLSDIVMSSSWNLQAGGSGMGGQSTQTVRLPYDDFRKFDADTFSEDNLKMIGILPKDVKTKAKEFSDKISSQFFG
jgi:hypothetical protein